VTLSKRQFEEFGDTGLLCLRGAIPSAAVMRHHVCEFLEREHGFVVDQAQISIPKKLTMSFRELRLRDCFADLAHAAPLVSELLHDRPWKRPRHWGTVLFTLPNATNWTLPHKLWHLDLPRFAMDQFGTPGVQLFLCLKTVRPGGGATLAIAGSHRIGNDLGHDLGSAPYRQHLARRHPWFRELFARQSRPNRTARFTCTTEVGGIPLEVVELTGEPGDLYLMDMRMLHVAAPNASGTARIMLSERLILEEARRRVYPSSAALTPPHGSSTNPTCVSS